MKIFVAIPTYNKQVDVEIATMLCRLPGEYPEHQFGIDFIASSIITSSRNYLVNRFLKTDFDYLYFWDADVVIRDASFLGNLLETSEKLDVPIVGGAYRTKGSDGRYAQADVIDGKFVNPLLGELTEPRLIDCLATGSMLIKREVLEKMPNPWFSFVDTKDGTTPEDFFFCLEAKKYGFKCAIDPRFATYHYGNAFWSHTLPDRNTETEGQ